MARKQKHSYLPTSIHAIFIILLCFDLDEEVQYEEADSAKTILLTI